MQDMRACCFQRSSVVKISRCGTHKIKIQVAVICPRTSQNSFLSHFIDSFQIISLSCGHYWMTSVEYYFLDQEFIWALKTYERNQCQASQVFHVQNKCSVQYTTEIESWTTQRFEALLFLLAFSCFIHVIA